MKKFNIFKNPTINSLPITSYGLVLALMLAPPLTHAEKAGYTNYVTDSLDVPLRRGPGYKFKINRMLEPGEAVKIQKVNDDNWVKVTYKTYEGWLPSVVLQNQPIAKVRLESQIEKTKQIEEKYQALQQELKTLQSRFESADSELSTLKQEKFELTKELEHLSAISKNSIQLDEQNQAMKVRLDQLENQNAIMEEQIDQSDDSIKRQWFLTGGGVLLLGLLLGRFFRPPSKRKKWGEL